MKISSLLLLLSFIFLPFLVIAQPGDPGDDPDAPIDGGVGLLVAAGIGYGARKVRNARNARLKGSSDNQSGTEVN